MNDSSQFLELTVPCTDIVASLVWFLQLGFTELPTSDIRTHHYAVITDGNFCIGLHDASNAQLGLSFVRKNIARHVRATMQSGQDFAYTHLGEDEFNEAALTDPDGTLAIYLEARTFSGSAETDQIPMTGGVTHIAVPCMQLNDSINFWQQHGFIALEHGIEGEAELHMPGLVVHLREGTRVPELHFQAPDLAASRAAIERSNTPFREGANGLSLSSPDGLRLLISSASALA